MYFGKSLLLFYAGCLLATSVAASLYADPCGTTATQTHEGDIAIPLSEDGNGRPAPPATGTGDTVGDTKRAATANKSWRWTYGVIPYYISQEYTASERQVILAAMDHWMNNTCVRFRQRTFEVDYANIYSGDCCASYVGRTGGLQGVSLNRRLCMSFPTIVHELGHALGFWHEQARPDRDSYVNIAYQNIVPGTGPNFDKLSSSDVNSLGVAYDYHSIMHYSQIAWSVNGQQTITSADPAYVGSIGGAVGLSVLDSYQTNLLYNCDSDECALHIDHCDKKANCHNVVGGLNSYRCQCMSGYYGNGTTCNSDVHVDECAQGTHVCQQNCTNTNASFVCSCERGYQLTSKGNCTDINECWTNNGRCPQLCQNTNGSYLCLCYSGYTLDIITHSCNDTNECLLMNGGCSGHCTNTPGSYLCSCDAGYALGANKRTCVDIDECSINNGGCSQLCQNTVGNYSCSCRQGYYLSSNGKTCLTGFINKCATNNGGCAQICVSIFGLTGSHVCLCRPGYSKGVDNTSCNDINECSTNNGGCSQACVNSVGSYSCRCASGYLLSSNMRTCNDINECQNTTVCAQVCSNTVGSYLCSCGSGYELAANGHDCRALAGG